MSTRDPHQDDDNVAPDDVAARDSSAADSDPLTANPYARRYQSATDADLDAGAPHLKSHELRRMNQRALLLLGAVVLLLLFVAYWLISGAGRGKEVAKPRSEKVTVAEAPQALSVPRLPQPQRMRDVDAIPLATPPLPPLPSAQATFQPQATPLRGRVPTLVERRVIASNGGDLGTGDSSGIGPGAGGGMASQYAGQATPSAMAAAVQPQVGRPSSTSNAQPLTHPDTLMQRGTYIRCVLETRVISDIPGFTSCLVTEPVYSFNGHRLLLPKGSKVLGSYEQHPTGKRIAVIWDRIITPTGIDVNMTSPGMDNLGGAGVPGHYDAHWANRINSALLISLLSDAFKYEAAEHGPRSTTISNGFVTQEPFESNTARTAQNLADQAVRAAANRPATVTINQGTVVYVYVAKDVDFSGVVARF